MEMWPIPDFDDKHNEAGTVAAAFKAQDAARAVVAAYDRALNDPQAKIPTALHMAIEAARRVC